MLRFAVATCVLLLFSAVPPLVWGQHPRERPSRYEPAFGPTLSPYLQQNSLSTGVLNNYYNFVRPRVQLRSMFKTQSRQIEQLHQEVRRSRTVSQARSKGITPTGISASFMNFSHYYSISPARRR